MTKYKGLFTFDEDNHRYVPIAQADGIIDCFKFKHESKEPHNGSRQTNWSKSTMLGEEEDEA